ncbi:MAG: ABC transporter ATP-binding protein/permease, partial [Alphaproteobacteria bacterium]|nr:ABC transporter ATP-binding protein/permease [Alphaproteobacteria bacterium]
MRPAAPAPPDAVAPKRNDLRIIATLLPYLWPASRLDLKVRVVIAMLFLIGAKIAVIQVPLLLGRIVNGLEGEGMSLVTVPIALIVAFGLARLLSVAFGELRDAVFAKVAQQAIREVALKTFRKLHGLSLRFHLDRRTGGLSRVIERGTKGIEFLLTFMLFNVLPTLLEIGLVVGVMLWNYDAVYALITAVSVIAYIGFTFFVTEWRTKFIRSMNDNDELANTKAIDSLLNYETVKYFSSEDHEASRYNNSLHAYQNAAVRTKVSLSLLNIGQGVVTAGGMTAVLLIAGTAVAAGEMRIGELVAINAFMLQLYQPLGLLGFVYRQIRQSLIDMERMFQLLGKRSEITDAPDAPALTVRDGAVAFEGVDFAYDSERAILHDISFTVMPGNTVAIVGPSGGGKSTISRLLFRFYEVNAGRITIDGQDIAHVSQASLRAAIGIVPQDTVLFNDSILYNIAYARPDCSEAEVAEVARLAHIDRFIAELSDGYESLVGERGLKLSGGEKQRVAIARMLLKAPRILIFDEATSALDTATEKEIQTNLREVSRGHTTLMVAHRLSTVVD